MSLHYSIATSSTGCRPRQRKPGAFERALLDIVDRERVDLVIPCRDDDVEFLASLRDRRPALAHRLLCGSAAPARVISDKWLSCRVQHPARPAVRGVPHSRQQRRAKGICRTVRLPAWWRNLAEAMRRLASICSGTTPSYKARWTRTLTSCSSSSAIRSILQITVRQWTLEAFRSTTPSRAPGIRSRR